MLGLAAGQLFTGPLSDSLGRRRPLVAGLVGYIAASLACALAPSIWALIGLRFVQGALGGAGVVIARAIVRDLFAGDVAARVFALLMAVMGVAPVFAPLVGGQVLAFTSWRGIFVLLAGIGVPLLLVTLLWLPETLPPERRHRGGLRSTLRTFGGLLRDRRFIVPATSMALAAGAMFAYLAGSTRVGSAVLLRFGLIALVVGAIGTLIVTLAHFGLVPLLISLFVILCSIGFVFPNATAVALAEQEGALGSASALLGVGQFGTGAVVAPLVGLAGPRDAVPMGVVIGVSGTAALAVNLVFSRPQTGASPRWRRSRRR